MEYTPDMQVQVKLEPEGAGKEGSSDPNMFSALQSELERMKERMKLLRKRILPIRKRLRKRMEEQQIAEMHCGNFVLEMEVDSESDDQDEAVFTRDRVREHFGEEQYEAYCESNQRPKRKKRKINCRRDVVDLEEDTNVDSES